MYLSVNYHLSIIYLLISLSILIFHPNLQYSGVFLFLERKHSVNEKTSWMCLPVSFLVADLKWGKLLTVVAPETLIQCKGWTKSE